MSEKKSVSLPGRRHFIRLLGGCSILLLPALSGCVNKESAGRPKTPPHDDPRYRWLTAGAQAPSSHNMQPWKVELTSGTAKLLYANSRYLLPEADPESRQTMVSLGGFLELLSMAAGAEGFCCDIQLFPSGENINQPVAQIAFRRAKGVSRADGLLPYISVRRTIRSGFIHNRPLTEERLSLLLTEGTCYGTLCKGSIGSQQVVAIGEMATNAWLTDISQPAIMQEMLGVTRIGRKEIAQHRDGIAIEGFLPELAEMLGMFPRDSLPAKDSAMMKNMQEMGKQQAASAAGWVWVVSPDNSRTAQIAAGRAFVRLHLRATQLGIALQPMSQGLERYPAMEEHRRALYRTLGMALGKETIQMLARVGYAEGGRATPRRSVSEFVVQKAI